MTPDFDRLAREIVRKPYWPLAHQHERDALMDTIAATLRSVWNQAMDEAAGIANNLGNWADAKEPRDDVADAEHVICTRIAAAIRGAKP